MEDRALVARDLDERRLFLFCRNTGTSADGRSDAAACEDRALSETKERGGGLSFLFGGVLFGRTGRMGEGGLWGEDGDREELCAYNKDGLSVVVS